MLADLSGHQSFVKRGLAAERYDGAPRLKINRNDGRVANPWAAVRTSSEEVVKDSTAC